MVEIHFGGLKMGKIDGPWSFSTIWKSEEINGRDKFEWEIKDPYSPTFWPKIAKC
jgi:hypothetical protein